MNGKIALISGSGITVLAIFILVMAATTLESRPPATAAAQTTTEDFNHNDPKVAADESDYDSDLESELEEQKENALEALARQDTEVVASLNKGRPVNTELISQNQTVSVFRHITHDAIVITGDYETGQSVHFINYREIITEIKDGKIVSSQIAKEIDVTKTIKFTQEQRRVVSAALEEAQMRQFLKDNEGRNVIIGYTPGAPGGTVTVSLQNLDDDTIAGVFIDPVTLKIYGPYP